MSGNFAFPNGCGILLVTQDGTLDLSEISWQEVSPCGCVSGVAMAATGPDEILTTAEQAGRSMSGGALPYARDVEQGRSWRPREHRAAVTEMQLDCPHVPKWGAPKIPKPDGMEWAAVHCLGSSPKLTHLVPTSAIERASSRNYGAGDTKPLCGGKGAFWWKSEWYATDGKVECKRCIAKAERLAVTA